MPEFVLQRPPPPEPAPELDDSQRAVLSHGVDGKGAGPLLVLAGPGTGKTATMVELVVDRVQRGLDPADALVLTFSRKAAQQLRARIARRLPDHGVVPAMTFHAYCYALVRAASSAEEFADPVRLLSAPEQEWRLAELLLGATDLGRITWPPDLGPALRTRGFTREIADFIGRARSYGLGPEDVHALADERSEPAWHAVSDLWREYEQVLALARETDYSGLVDDALSLPELPQPRLVVVDEYQDTDAAQVALLQRLVGPTTDLVAVGDPDQSIYAFRGADVRGVWQFADHFGSAARPAATLALRRARRFGPTLLDASRAVIDRIGVSGSVPAEQFAAFRRPEADPGAEGDLEVLTFTDARAEAEHIASLLRRAIIEDGVAPGEMAVLVRAGHDALAPYERALRTAGLPVQVAGDEIPLATQPAVRSLLFAARAALGLARGRALLPEEAETLLTGPFGRLDPAELRRLARALRQQEAADTGLLRDSRDVVAEALAEPAFLARVASGRLQQVAGRAERLATTLAAAARLVIERVPAEEVLWQLWNGSPGHAWTDPDLDALVALFDDAARSQERGARVELAGYLDQLEGQQIPGDTLAERGTRPQAVRLMTAHRAKGLEWDLVVVAGVQDGVWPSTRAAGSLLRTERLDPRGDGTPPSFGRLLAEERRLFYVAITRARRRLVVTAVESLATDGEQPSRFHEELRPFHTGEPQPVPQRAPRRPVSLRGAVTQLRWLSRHGATEAVRAEADERLTGLRDVVPAADPDTWWGTRELTTSEVPVRDPDAPLALSGSAVSDITTCALRWFLSREARGTESTSTAQGFGLAVHVLAAELVDRLSVDIDADELVSHLDSVWHRLDFDTPWIAVRERAEADSAVRRLVRWHVDRGGRTTVGAEHEFLVEVPVRDDTVVLRGSMDRVEIDAEGRVHVVDFKTGKSKPTAADLEVHAQMGTYQVAVLHGAVPGHDTSGGAELVHLRQELAVQPGLPVVQVQEPPEAGRPFFADDLLQQSRDVVRLERFDATVNVHCPRCSFRRCCPAFDGGPTAQENR